MNYKHLKTIGFLPLTVIPAVFLIGSIVIHDSLEDEEVRGRVSEQARSVQLSLERDLSDHAGLMRAACDGIKSNDQLAAALKERNRTLLLELSRPIHERLRDECSATHLSFMTPDRVTVLRVHQPDEYGDTINRHTMLEAERTGEAASGLEEGPMGTLVLRTVVPWVYRGGLVGYVELGEDLDSFVSRLGHVFGVEICAAISKQHLNRERWGEGAQMSGRQDDWDQHPSFVISHGSSGSAAAMALEALKRGSSPAQEVADVSDGNRRYLPNVLSLRVAGDREVGTLIVLSDVTDDVVRERTSALWISGITAGAACVLLVLFLIKGLTARVLP